MESLTHSNNHSLICDNCGGTNISHGKLLKHAEIVNVKKKDNSFFSSNFTSPLILYVCVNCGKVLSIFVENTTIFNEF